MSGGVVSESASPWASPWFWQRKKVRFGVDYRQLNGVIMFPLLCLSEFPDQLGGKRLFSTLDAKSGYW